MYILADIGGTNTRVAVSFTGDGFEEPIIYNTPKNFEEGLAKFKETVKSLSQGNRPKGLSIGIPGTLNSKKTKLLNSPNLPNWNQKPFHKELFMEYGCEVLLENDAVLAGLGEIYYGAGIQTTPLTIIAYFTIGTGIGGAVFFNGEPLPSKYGFEPGHQVISNNKTFEQLAGGGHVNYDLEEDKLEAKRFTVTGIYNSILHWSPDLVIMGGGLVNHNIVDVNFIKSEVENLMQVFPKAPEFKKSVLGDLNGIYGALANITQHIA